MHCSGVLKNGKKCTNPAKFGEFCGVHNNVKKQESKKTQESSKKSSMASTASGKRQLVNLEKMEKIIHEKNKKLLKAMKKELETPSRRRSA